MSFLQDYIQQNDSIGYRFTRDDFDPTHWLHLSETEVLSGGRGGSYKICIQDETYVLHRYIRGGMIARFLHDRYLWTGKSKTRPLLEQQLVNYALKKGLPVPELVAFRIQRKGLFYLAVSISRFIENQGSLASCIAKKALENKDWFNLGTLIRKMHDQDICHVDLNANNILLDDSGAFHLIDFDKAVIDRQGIGWREANLDRLRRSIFKIKMLMQQQQKKLYFSEENWDSLLQGYKTDI